VEFIDLAPDWIKSEVLESGKTISVFIASGNFLIS
jgi:hypothetical protein